jgi:gas vesicle protein
VNKLIAFLAGAALGGLVGATLAVLMAPYSGEELRGRAQGRYLEIRSQVTEAAAARRAELEQQLQALRAPKGPTTPVQP